MSEPMNLSMPFVIERTSKGERTYDLPSRLMQDRIIMIDSGVTEQLAHIVTAQLLYLDNQNTNDIYMYINSPGGSVHAGLKIADQMELCRSNIVTICTGYGASMGCYLTAAGDKRFMTRRAYLMAHQVSSGTQGHVADQLASLNHTQELNDLLMTDLSTRVGMDHEQFMIDCNRDKWMSAVQSRDYGTNGFVDGIYTGKRNSDGAFEVEYRNGKLEYI